MQKSCLFSYPNSFSPLSLFPNPIQLQLLLPLHYSSRRTSKISNFRTILPFNYSVSSRLSLHPLHSTVFEDITETSTDESEFVEVGYICKVHGIQGEVRVKPNTDFPELRFAQPGRRWLKEQYAGKDVIREVELVEGRDHPGQKSWIVSFSGIDTVDKAKQLIGSTLLVKEEDRPILEEGEIYTRDLVGMKVILKETDQLVGTVINVFNSGGPNDLLQVQLNPEEKSQDESGTSESGQDVSGHLAWIPFVEAIVPDVDMNRREMKITPPKGLLELNVRSDTRSKKERRQLEWKERKKATRRLIVAKKKLIEMHQKHIFHGLRFGEKAQKSLLADHIVGINFKLFQQALQNFETVSTRWNLTDFVNAYATRILENPMKVSEEHLLSSGANDKMGDMKKKGLNIISEGKAAVVLVLDGQTNFGSVENQFKMGEDRGLVPLIVISSSHETQITQNMFLDNDYFGFDADKVWLLEEEKLPVVSSSVNEQNKHTVLMKSPWEILQSPVGSGGIFSLLSAHNILENLSEVGVEYVQVCGYGEKSVIGNPLFLGFVESRKAEIGIKMSNSIEDSFDVIFSMKALKKIVNQVDKLKFHAITKLNNHVEFVDNDKDVDVIPTEPNSYEFHCSIYSCLSVCDPDRVCVMEVDG